MHRPTTPFIFLMIVYFIELLIHVASVEDTNGHQEDPNRLSEQANTWQLKVNINKCITVICCTISVTPLSHP